MSMFGRDLLGNVRMRIVHFGFIYAQKDSFAHRYGLFEICGDMPLDLGCFGPVARSRRALYLRRAAGGCFGCCGAGAGPLALALLALVCGSWSAGTGLRELDATFVCFRGGRLFFIPHIAWRPVR